jgi:cellulose synthase/poly-beta-1,6-N-acetylglucosamine synthase-like glycosyltransferase
MPEAAAISILLPAWNAAATLPTCLRSIQRQSDAGWRCIVVDDGSTDETAACVSAFAAGDRRFALVRQPHRGLVQALQSGLQYCDGRFVARMDADDLMHRDRLAAQRAALEADSTLAAVGSHVRLFPRAGLGQGWRDYEAWLNSMSCPEQIAADALIESPLAHPTLMLRREILAAVGYREVAWPEDYDLILRLLAAGHRLGVVPRRLLSWRDHPNRLTHSAPRYRIEAFPICKAAFLASGLLAASQSYILWGYGSTGRALQRALLAHGKRVSYIVEMHPGRLGNRIHGATVIPPEALPTLPRLPLIASVAGSEPRRRIRTAVSEWGWVEGKDFVCAA